MTIWYMRIKQGKGGRDFTQEVWHTGHVGIMFGNWPLNDVINEAGAVDPTRVDLDWLQRDCPSPTPWLTKRHVDIIRRFLLAMVPGDAVVAFFDGSYHLGIVGDEFGPDFPVDDGEILKRRCVRDCRSYSVDELPSVFRLLRLSGQAAIQKMGAFARQAQLLIDHPTADEVRNHMLAMPRSEFLSMLSDSQWERACEELLRANHGFRSLLLSSGRSLPDVDLVGVGLDGRRILAQCKNASLPQSRRSVAAWASTVGRPGDLLFFFNRGGFSGATRDDVPMLVDGAEVDRWLEGDVPYERAIRSL